MNGIKLTKIRSFTAIILTVLSLTAIIQAQSADKTKFDFEYLAVINVTNVEELYAAVNNPANTGNQIILAAGVYTLSATDSGGAARPNGGRIELQENMALRGVSGNRGAVVIDASALPASSYSSPIANTGAVRLGKGTNSVEWLTVRNALNGGAGIIVHLSAPATAFVRIAHCVSTGNQRGVDIRNVAANTSGFIIEAEIVDNDFYSNRISTQQGLRIINQAGVSGNNINAFLSGNRIYDNGQGLLVENLASSNGAIISIYSSGDRFFENGGGATIGSALGPSNNNTVNFTAVGSAFENNNSATDFYRGGLNIAGSISFQTANGGSNNTANVNLRNCRFSNNQVTDLAAFGASSFPVSIGSSGINNRANVRLFGTVTPNTRVADSDPANPAGMNSATLTRPSQFDFDGDSRADLAVFRLSEGNWWSQQSTNGFAVRQFGLSTDKLAPADYDGDGKTDIGIFRDGVWWWINSSNNQVSVMQFGQTGDIPQPADFDGDGRAELVVFGQNGWTVRNSATGNISNQPADCGIADNCYPIVNDYDGDGRADYATYGEYAANTSEWYIHLSSGGYAIPSFGINFDKPVPADYDGDGKTDIAVFRPSNGTWHIWRSKTNDLQIVSWGLSTDKPVPADYDGDGKADIAIFRDGAWWILQSSSGNVSVQQFGLTDDKPVPAAYLP